MLTPSPIQRFNVDPMHPYFVPELEEKIVRGEMVVTVNDQPVVNVLGFSVPDGYVKRIATKDDFARIVNLTNDENQLARLYRDGVRVKGVVRVYAQV